ncbi:hypothetical protein Tco_1311795 [Tanacetum coccineum]
MRVETQDCKAAQRFKDKDSEISVVKINQGQRSRYQYFVKEYQVKDQDPRSQACKWNFKRIPKNTRLQDSRHHKKDPQLNDHPLGGDCLESKMMRECCFVVERDAWLRGEFTLSSLDVLQRFSFFLQMGFTLILATLDGLNVGLLGDVIGEDDCDDDG